MTREIDIFAPVRDLGKGDALESWRWLVGKSASVKLLTAMGDIFFVKPSGIFRSETVFFLDTNAGTIEKASKSWASFRAAIKSMDNIPGHWFKYSLLTELSDSPLAEGNCYSPDHAPILGGDYERNNFQAVSWSVHVNLSGQIHEQIQKVPKGTPISNIKLKQSDS